jgi:histidinol-phosphate aminotransferase
MGDSHIRASVRRLHAYVPGEQPPDGTMIKLNTNENPYPPSPAVEAALRSLGTDRLRRYPPPDNAALRRRIADLHGCRVENTFAGNGSDEVLALCTRAFTENGGSIGYFEPSYSLYPVLADIRDVRRCPVALGEGFTWRTPPADGCGLFFLTNPNAPTGMAFPKPAIDAFCAAFKGVVLIDEAYADFARENCMDLALRHDNVLVSRTLSKSYALAGLRVGYCVGSPVLIEAMTKVKDSYNLDAVAQALALAALNDTAYMRTQVARIIEQRERLTAALSGMGFEVFPSQTNFLWTRPPAGIPANVFFETLRGRGILVRYFPDGQLGAYVRITIGTPDEMTSLIETSAEILPGLSR